MRRLTQSILGGLRRSVWQKAAIAGLSAASFVPTAHAGDWDFLGFSADHGGFRVNVDVSSARDRFPRPEPYRTERIWVDPVYRTVCDRVWVAPEYRTVTERVWREPVVKDVCDSVWVDGVFEDRQVIHNTPRGRRIERERVCVRPGHWEERHRQVVVRDGCWENVQHQELVCAGHWQNVERQELVSAGHWEERVVHVDAAPWHVDRDAHYDRGDRYRG